MSYPPALTQARIVRFWAPLASTWLMMSVEGPFVAAIIARLPEPKYNLAAFSVAFAFAMMIESPIIMMLSAATALARDRGSFLALRRFAYTANLLITGAMGVLLTPAVFRLVTESLIGLPHQVAHLAHGATFLLLPWPAAIGYRRFYQGVLIRHGLTRRVAYGTALRVGGMAATATALWRWSNLPGAWVGGAALAVGVLAEAVASRIWAARSVRAVLATPTSADEPLTTHRITSFYAPLALTSLLTLAVNPMVTFFLGHGRQPLDSLAVLPVVTGLVFAFRSVGIAFQEVGIALLGDQCEGLPSLRRFATTLGLAASLGLVGMACSPLARLWLGHVAGLPADLVAFALLPLRLLVLMPGLEVLLSFQRSLLLRARRTRWITAATGIEVAGIVIVLTLAIAVMNAVGAVAAALSFSLGRLAANLFLLRPARASVASAPR
jgi:progressive ankylosis protein